MTFFDIKFAEIFKTDDWVRNASLIEMGNAEVQPFVSELRVDLHQRHEIARKSHFPSAAPGPDDPVDRNFDQPDIHGTDRRDIDHFIQNSRIRIFTAADTGIVIFLTELQCVIIFVDCFDSAHRLFSFPGLLIISFVC